MLSSFRRTMKKLAWTALPLGLRKNLAIWLDRQSWLSSRHTLSMRLVSDWAEKDMKAFHRFLWSNHLGYAAFYEAANEFGAEKLHPARRLFFADLMACLEQQGIHPETDVQSVFEMGCSSGFMLRFAETNLFPAATDIAGIDIDAAAVRRGQEYLAQQGSKVRVECADMADLDGVLGGKCYDVILCLGVLLYLDQEATERVVRSAIEHARLVVAIVGLGNPELDNAMLMEPVRRVSDASLIHNIDAMVEKAGAKILFRRWEGERQIGGQHIYFVFSSGKASKVTALSPSSTGRLLEASK